MSAEFTRDHCKLAVAKILQTIGWHSINSTPLEVLTDILSKYIKEIAKYTNEYANEFGQVEPNLDHLGLAFQEMGVNLGELEEYVNFVNFIPPANSVPKYPIPKESNLNFLKPGSKEVVTRPVHINEHLPPMYPLMEEEEKNELNDSGNLINNKESSTEPGTEFKKPPDVNSPEFKRLKREEESSRPTREISSVMMTTSGFLSPAREGRLPEAKVPIPPPEPPRAPSPPISVVVPEIIPVSSSSSSKKKPDKKKEKIPKDLSGTKAAAEDKPSKKINNMKDILTMKRAKALAAANPGAGLVPNFLSPSNNSSSSSSMRPFLSPGASFPGDIKMPSMAHHHSGQKSSSSSVHSRPSSFNKTLAAAKAKTEKLNTTITPIIPLAKTTEQRFSSSIDKLVNEPADRKKINILRKISNVKEKTSSSSSSDRNKPPTQAQLIQQTQDIVSKINLSNDITIEPITPSSSNSIKMEQNYFDDGSPPGTPPTPRTPELLTHHHSPPFVANINNNTNKERRKRKEKPDKSNKVKKPRKNAAHHNQMSSASHHHHHHHPQHHPNNFLDSSSVADLLDISGMGRPKTPDAAHLLFGKKPPFPHPMPGGPTGSTNPLTFPFLPNFGGPGLIPSLPFRFPPPDFSGFHGISSHNIKTEPTKKISPRPNKEIPSIKTEPAEILTLPSTPGIMSQNNKSPIPHLLLEEPSIIKVENCASSPAASASASDLTMKKTKEHKKDKKDKTKKKNKKEKFKDKAEKKKLKELKKEKLKLKKEKKKKLLLKASSDEQQQQQQQQKLPLSSTLSEFPESGSGGAAIIPKMILKVSSPSPRPDTPDSLKKLNIKPIIKKEVSSPSSSSAASERHETTSPAGLAQISALVIGPPKPKTLSPSVVEKGVSTAATEISPSTSSGGGTRPPGRPRIHPIKPKPVPKAAKKLEQQRPFVKRDAEGNEVWICPACSQQDDGRPMIGCDGCDAWYHWVCVGIQVPPDENENWYCKPCLAKKNEDFQDKKKKRKKNNKDKNY